MSEKDKRKIKYHPIYPDSWNPTDPGDIISGNIFCLGSKMLGSGYVNYIEIMDVDSDNITQVLMGAAALAELLDAGVIAPGNFISLRYDGLSTKVIKGKNQMKLFSAYVENDKGEIIWPIHRNEKSKTKKQIHEEALEKVKQTTKEITG